ncbi:MAG TPA: CHAD domain-containing protein [Caulobacteraceae bacterium]|jgi:triphosphatase|nr:CHAD domain-containing protein [Caulobacteraceae bacterium]
MAAEPREVELKFHVQREVGEALLASLDREPDREVLESTYFDTDQCSLRRAGLALRVRREDGRWLQTVKSSRTGDGALGRGEWEATTAGDEPDLDHARRTPAGRVLAKDGDLAPKFTVIVDRRTVPLQSPRGSVSCSLDRGEVHAGGRAHSFDELELELESGELAALFDVAGDLARRFPLALSFTTKPERGFALLADKEDGAFRFDPPALTRRMSAGQAFRAIARAALEQVARNGEAICRQPGVEAVHQMRVGARRLRSTLKIFRWLAHDNGAGAVDADLRWLGAELDPARNLDVFINGAWRRAAECCPAEAAREAQERLETAREGAYARARAAAQSEKLRTFLLDTMIWIESGAWMEADAAGARRRDAPVDEFASRALDRAWRKLLKKGRGLEDLSPEDRHRARIRAKELRYAVDALAPLFDSHPRRAKRFVSTLKDLLDHLGELNDIVTAAKLAGDYPPADDLLTGEARREAKLLARSCDCFDELESAKPFWG